MKIKKNEEIEKKYNEKKEEKNVSNALKLKMIDNKNDLIQKAKKGIIFIRKKINDKK